MTQTEFRFNATLISVSDNILENSNGTEFRICSIKLPNGKVVSGRVYEKNLSHGMTPGTDYLCTARPYADTNGVEQVDITVSHLTQAPRASMSDFDGITLDAREVEVPVKEGTLVPETI
mgnify:CR=1 FL=1